MEIIICHSDNRKEYFDQAYGITSSYKKFIKNGSTAKVMKMSHKLIIRLVFVAVYIVFCVLTAMHEAKPVGYAGLGVGICAIVILIKKSTVYFRTRKAFANSKTDSSLYFDGEVIKLVNRTAGREFSLKWEDTVQILFTSRCIFFMPAYEKEKTKNIITVPREYEDEIINVLNEYNKKYLTVYNNH